jgi:hypothetical protein
VAQAAQITGANGHNVEKNWPILCRAFEEWGIASPLSCIGAIGTIAKETAGTFAPVEEAFWLSPAAKQVEYAKHSYGGGPQYHGRGFVQTTHLSNYKRVQDILAARGRPLDIVGNPDLLLDPEISAQAFCIYWTDHDLNTVCERQDWAEVRRRVYGGNDPDGTTRIAAGAGRLIPLAQARGTIG